MEANCCQRMCHFDLSLPISLKPVGGIPSHLGHKALGEKVCDCQSLPSDFLLLGASYSVYWWVQSLQDIQDGAAHCSRVTGCMSVPFFPSLHLVPLFSYAIFSKCHFFLCLSFLCHFFLSHFFLHSLELAKKKENIEVLSMWLLLYWDFYNEAP